MLVGEEDVFLVSKARGEEDGEAKSERCNAACDL